MKSLYATLGAIVLTASTAYATPEPLKMQKMGKLTVPSGIDPRESHAFAKALLETNEDIEMEKLFPLLSRELDRCAVSDMKENAAYACFAAGEMVAAIALEKGVGAATTLYGIKKGTYDVCTNQKNIEQDLADAKELAEDLEMSIELLGKSHEKFKELNQFANALETIAAKEENLILMQNVLRVYTQLDQYYRSTFCV